MVAGERPHRNLFLRAILPRGDTLVAQWKDQVSAGTASGVQDPHPGCDAAFQKLVEKIDVDLAEFGVVFLMFSIGLEFSLTRLKAYDLGGKKAEVVAIPWHFGYNGYITGGPDRKKNYSANQLTHKVGDANTRIPEYKAFMCDIVKA